MPHNTTMSIDRPLNHGRRRCLLIAIGLYTMIQAIIYCGLAAVSVITHRCGIDVQTSRFANLLYTTYLARESCGLVDWSLLNGNAALWDQTVPSMPPITAVAFRTDIFAICYIALSGLWLISSIGLLCAANATKRCLVWFWWTVTAAVCVLDVAMSVFNVMDLVHSMNTQSFLRNFEITVLDADQSFHVPKHMLPGPAAVMMAVSTRFIFFWVVNVVLLFCVVPMALRKPKDQLPVHSPALTEHRLSHRQTIDRPIERQFMRPVSIRLTKNVGEDGLKRTSLRASLANTVVTVTPRDSIETRVRATAATHRYDDTAALPFDEQLPQPDYASPPAATAAAERSVASSPGPATPRARTDELRSQLPWSYFKSPDDMLASRRTLVQLRDGEEMPPVPVPDYTLHFPRRDRPTTSSKSSDEGVWY